MNFQNQDITRRTQESSLFPALEKQMGETLPYLLERYLLLENWQYLNKQQESQDRGDRVGGYNYDFSYVHLLLADACTALLSHEERIRALEARFVPEQPHQMFWQRKALDLEKALKASQSELEMWKNAHDMKSEALAKLQLKLLEDTLPTAQVSFHLDRLKK